MAAKKGLTFTFVCLLLLNLLVGCQALPLVGKTLPVNATQPVGVSASTELASTPSPQALATSTSPAVSPLSITLRLWLPPQWDPASGTTVGDLLDARLRAFEAQNPDVHLEVRLKALEGTGGLLEALANANAAAPLALPDLVALPRSLLESAALKSLVYPFDGLTAVMETGGWYEYASQLAHLQDSIYGLPFAGDALLLAYRPSVMETPPRDWESALSLGSALIFPAADPQALFTLLQYQAAGGAIQDDQGRPYLDEAILAQVLTFYQQASQAGAAPFWLTQLETDEQAWQAFGSEQAPMTTAWSSLFFSTDHALSFEADFAPLLTTDGEPYTLGDGWVWALASPDPERRALAAQLAEFLVNEQFLAAWTSVAGYLPPRAEALAGWGEASQRPVVDSVSLSAHLLPSADVLSSLGPVLKEAVAEVLKQQSDPQSAAQAAAELVNQP
jgi:multiple sugar transport system substrate-binding protein